MVDAETDEDPDPIAPAADDDMPPCKARSSECDGKWASIISRTAPYVRATCRVYIFQFPSVVSVRT